MIRDVSVKKEKVHLNDLQKRNLRKTNLRGFMFAAPWIVGFLCFSVYPLITSLYYSFTEFNPIKDPIWVGLANYLEVFKDPRVWKSFRNTLFIAFVGTPINLAVALTLASLVKPKYKGRTVVRTVFFLPAVIPMIAATMVWIWMFDPTYGYIKLVLGVFGIESPSWLLDPAYTKWALIMMGSWCVGTTMLTCLSALNNVSDDYYEAASIDGAGKILQFFHITLPGIANVLVYQGILSLINAFQYFTQVYVITSASAGMKGGDPSGGPGNSILMYPLYIYHNAFYYFKMGKATAMSWLLFILVALLTVVMVKISKKIETDNQI